MLRSCKVDTFTWLLLWIKFVFNVRDLFFPQRKKRNESRCSLRHVVALFVRNNEVLWMWRCTEECRPKAQRFNGESGKLTVTNDQSSWEFCGCLQSHSWVWWIKNDDLFAMWRQIGWWPTWALAVAVEKPLCWSRGASIDVWLTQGRDEAFEIESTWGFKEDVCLMTTEPFGVGVGVRVKWQLPEVPQLRWNCGSVLGGLKRDNFNLPWMSRCISY